MRSTTPPPSRRLSSRGFTLIELMIVVIVIALIAAVVYPSFQSQVRKGRRSDAVQLLAQVQQLQERWRANNTSYGSLANLYGGAVTSVTSAGGYYTVGLSNVGASGYTATATAVTGTSQASDTCTTLTITVTNGDAAYSSNGAGNCWSK